MKEVSEQLIALRQALYNAVFECTSEIARIGVAFSGGIDSSLLAKICHDVGKRVTLVTIGFSSSHDVDFSKIMASKMDMDHTVYEIDYVDFQENLPHIRQAINCKNISHIENCIAFYYICKLAKQNHFSVVLSANGCDELFCGYDRYRKVYGGGEIEIRKLMEELIANEFALMEEIKAVAAPAGVQVRQPFLSSRFIEYAKTIPIDLLIKGDDDLIRKHLLREVALEIGVPEESAMKPKKALQYGSSIHKYFKKTERRKSILQQ